MMTADKMSTRDLSLAALDVQVRHVDGWSGGYGERWESYEADWCEGSDTRHKPVLVLSTSPECETCGADLAERFDGPMMNYWYGLPAFRLDATEAARRLVDLPLALVNFTEPESEDEAWALALTGGGMDLSWEICMAYVALGYVPPRHFWVPPKMAGYALTPKRRDVLAAIEKGIKTDRVRAKHAAEDVRAMRAYLTENSERQRRRR